jgi:hypothetical protein
MEDGGHMLSLEVSLVKNEVQSCGKRMRICKLNYIPFRSVVDQQSHR